jgi:hypothetical protein
MKTIFPITIIISIILMISCGKKDYEYQKDQYIENKSGHDCTLRLYDLRSLSQGILVDTILLTNNSISSSIMTEYSESKGITPFSDVQNNKILADSIVVIFDNNKQLNYNRFTKNRNIFRLEYYNEIITDYNIKYIFTITAEDYQGALPGK